jgi:hypothetical protein
MEAIIVLTDADEMKNVAKINGGELEKEKIFFERRRKKRRYFVFRFPGLRNFSSFTSISLRYY